MKVNRLFIVLVISALVLNFPVVTYGKLTNERIVYPYLADILEEYCYCYLTGPSNLKELVEFTDELYENFSRRLLYYNILKTVTFPMLEERINDLYFVNNICLFTLKFKDTILYSSDILPCCFDINMAYPEERWGIILERIRRFMYAFDKAGKYIFKLKQLPEKVYSEMKKVYTEYKVDKQNFVMLEFDMNKGVSTYCEKDMLDCNNAYFERIADILEPICKKYKVQKLVFYAYRLL